MNCKKCNRLQAEVDELWRYRKRAEKAEKERDEARESPKEANATVASLRTEQPRPFTPDAITDEMIQRARKVWTEHYGTPGPANGFVAEVLTAALTEPPARPEGAEKIEAVLNRYWSGDINGDDLADRIAEEMNR